jgi:hypothetical protein
MGANAQTTVPSFSSGEVLTAANQNISAGTGVPVFAGTAERDAAFGGSGEKVLAEGQLCYLESTNVVQYYDGAAWATVGPSTASGLTLISNTVIGSAVASVTVSSAFSSTYDNYKITITGGVASAGGNITMQLGSTTTGYYMSADRTSFGGVENLNGYANQANWAIVGGAQTDVLGLNIDLLGPNLAKKTLFMGIMIDPSTTGVAGNVGGFLNNSTQYTAFTVSGVTFTGGNIRVYGYANS